MQPFSPLLAGYGALQSQSERTEEEYYGQLSEPGDGPEELDHAHPCDSVLTFNLSAQFIL
jgi:hypothetical protein